MKLLLFSNSTNFGEPYLSYTIPYIRDFIGNLKEYKAIFIPFAAVSISYDEYFQMVYSKLYEFNINISSLHQFSDPKKSLNDTDLIIVGGGNTFALLKRLQDLNLLNIIRDHVKNGVPYIGWSAGSNLACPTIKTTNDMPIFQPDNYSALNLIPFQINPHYTDLTIQGHGGESRETRINEFLIANPEKWVVGLREGTLLEYCNQKLTLKGNESCRIFRSGINPKELTADDDLNFLMQ